MEHFLTCYVKESGGRSEQVRTADTVEVRTQSGWLGCPAKTFLLKYLKYSHRETQRSEKAFRVSTKLYRQILLIGGEETRRLSLSGHKFNPCGGIAMFQVI